jgi:Family of unknown function (DUF5677)
MHIAKQYLLDHPRGARSVSGQNERPHRDDVRADLGCGQRASPELDAELTIISGTALEELERAIRAVVDGFGGTFKDAEHRAMWKWGISLATLTQDVASSAHILVTHSSIRAAMILNRSLSEYGVRLEFYMQDPAAAVADISQMETEMRKVLQSRPIDDLEGRMPTEMFEALQRLVQEPNEKTTRRQIKSLFEQVFAEKSTVLYQGHYAIASAFVHGSALATADVIRRAGGTDPTDYTFHLTTNVFSLNKVLGETVIHVIAMLRTLYRLFGQPNAAEDLATAIEPILTRIDEAPS